MFGVLCLLGSLIAYLESLGIIERAFVIGLIPAILTSAGTLPVIFIRRREELFIDVGLGFSAGIMLVASFTSLLIPASEIAHVGIVIGGFIVGVVFIKALDTLIPHFHVERGYEGPVTLKTRISKAWLIALAIIVHNIPEGMAVGASSSYTVNDGLLMALAIGIQDIPEGLAVAIPIALTGSIAKAIIVGVLSGLTEAFSATIPAFIVSYISITLPFVMSLSAGAMIYVVTHEIIPEIMGKGKTEKSTYGFLIGFLTMFLLDSLLK